MRRTALALAFFALPLFAADPPKPDLYVVHEEVVPPGMVMKYEAVTKEMLGTLAAKKVTNPNVAFSAYQTSDMHYVYLSHLSGGLSGLEPMYNAWMSMPETVGKDAWRDLEARGNAAMTSYNDIVIARRDDLSYEPATPRLKPEERAYYRWQFYYLQPGKEMEAEQIAKDYATLFRSKNAADGFTIFTAVMGQDLPLLVAAIPARSAADFAAVDEKNMASLGNDLRALQMRALGVSRRIETREGWYRPDLSYPMPAKMAK